jgi:hypothetical protein
MTRSSSVLLLPTFPLWALRDPEVIGGAFYRKFDGRHPRLRWLEVAGRFFTRHGGSFFGDQSIFVRRETFRALGGFASIPLMEDMEFSRRLRRAGKVAVLDPPLQSSTRRHLGLGPWRTSIRPCRRWPRRSSSWRGRYDYRRGYGYRGRW